MQPLKSAALVLAPLLLCSQARAADWGFCIAPSDSEGRIYISLPFSSERTSAETVFEDALARQSLAHDSVQCRRADDRTAALAMQEYAVSVNRKWGRQVIELQWPLAGQ
jgi:hypothetical protein